MHRTDNKWFLLFIEPKKEEKLTSLVDNEWTQLMEEVFNRKDTKAGVSDCSYTKDKETANFTIGAATKGWHTTPCGKYSSNQDYLLFNGMIVNSLCVFYLQWYYDSIPESEWIKLRKLKEDLENLTHNY